MELGQAVTSRASRSNMVVYSATGGQRMDVVFVLGIAHALDPTGQDQVAGAEFGPAWRR